MEFKSDTLIIRDTLKGFKTDTIFKGFNSIDTFYQDTGGIKVRSIVKWNTKTIYQELIKKDTIVETEYITETRKVVQYKLHDWAKSVIIGMATVILLLMFFLYALFRKK